LHIFTAYEQNGYIATCGLKSDVTTMFLNQISCSTRECRQFAYI